MKILVVDDEKLLVKGMKFNLENEGYEVMTAYDGAAAVELEKKENFDLIFLDPPYGTGMLEKAMEIITEIDIVSENGIIVCENGSSADWPAVKAPYRLQKDYRYGKIRTALYRRETE